jgi:hypothetical protein
MNKLILITTYFLSLATAFLLGYLFHKTNNIIDNRVPHSLIESTDDYMIPATVDPNYADLRPIPNLKHLIRPIPRSIQAMTPEEIEREDAKNSSSKIIPPPK